MVEGMFKLGKIDCI